MERIIYFITKALPYVIISVPIILTVRFFYIRSMKKRGIKISPYREAAVIIFLFYLIGLASLTIGLSVRGVSRINIIPFQVFADAVRAIQDGMPVNYINLIGNIVVFVPIGFFVPLLWKNFGMGKTCLTGFIISLFIEVCQLPLDRGTDIDDLWLNTLGVFLGYLIYFTLERIYPNFTKRFKVTTQTQTCKK